jgi:hypothetical protein
MLLVVPDFPEYGGVSFTNGLDLRLQVPALAHLVED